MSEGCVSLVRALTRTESPPSQSRITPGELSCHLCVILGDLAPVTSEAVIYCQLYSETSEAWASERWCGLRPGASLSTSPSPGDQVTLFTDVGDPGPDLHCVVTVYRLGKMVNTQVVV